MPQLIRTFRDFCSDWLAPAFEQLAKAEIKLVAITVCTIAVSMPGSFFLSLQAGVVDVDAEVYACKPTLGPAMQHWAAEQQKAGVVATLSPFPGANASPDATRYHIHYVASGLALLRVSTGPLPEAFVGNCSLSGYNSTSKLADASPAIDVLIVTAPMYLAIALLVPWSLRTRRESLVPGVSFRQGLRSVPRWCLPLGVATCAGSLFAVWLFSIDVLGFRDVSLWQSVPWLGGLLAIVAAPVFEELLFRRWLLESFLREGLPIFGSIVVSVNFALPHMARFEFSTNFFSALSVFFAISLVLSWVYARTRNVFACMAVHCAHNASALIAGFLLP